MKLSIKLVDGTALAARNAYKNYNSFDDSWTLTATLPVGKSTEEEVIGKLTSENLSTVTVLNDDVVVDTIVGFNHLRSVQVAYDDQGKTVTFITANKAQ